ncbi:hypothetical protein FHG55_11785 [Pseudomonas jessenii]|uniref:Uncharacterized protein n=1 Tax=Pseudomonas jessenii TaxID=77298 RepID=A0A5C4KZK2_PSEJE|nr:hypothetical protein [Pseudomonas jessenii]TNB96168.1 hypothetical protein FHG55_11785 [Pseudomonas jessenii]
MEQKEDVSSRFWEFYALRYSVGAVLGGLILFFLVQQNKPISSLVFVKSGEPIDLIQVGIFLAAGLVFSYLASAPILVLHAGRFLIQRSSVPARYPSKSMVLFLLISMIVSVSFFFLSSMGVALKIWFSIVIFLAVSIIVGQFFIIVKCQRNSVELFRFYRKLALKRSRAKGGIVDSYRHLREHGNAFGIVLFQVILALFLFAATTYASYSNSMRTQSTLEVSVTLVVVLMVWILPATLVWLVGCIIEQEFVDS